LLFKIKYNYRSKSNFKGVAVGSDFFLNGGSHGSMAHGEGDKSALGST